MSDHEPALCECGCGEPAPIATRSRSAIGHVKGQPIRFIAGHRSRTMTTQSRKRAADHLASLPPSDGLCRCGCGEPAPIARATNWRRGFVEGQPQKFIKGHATTRKERTPCAAPGCEVLITADYCPKHATRLKRHGNLDGKRPQGSAVERFWRQVHKTETCWLWSGSVADTGYGLHWTDEKVLAGAHRFSYELHLGPIPTGLQVDHRCRVRRCVNPAHLEPVTAAENARRARLTAEEHMEARVDV